MSRRLTENIQILLRELITKLSGFDSDSENFKIIEEFAHSHVDSYHYFFTNNRRDVEKRTDGLSEKFHFHGFVGQASDLKYCTKTFLDTSNSDDDLRNRLAVIKLLIEISESPTKYFSEHPDEFKTRYKGLHEDVNWKKYLCETKVPYKTSYAETSEDDWSDLDDVQTENVQNLEIIENLDEIDAKILNADGDTDNLTDDYEAVLPFLDIKIGRTFEADEAIAILSTNIQSHWWNEENIYEYPESNLDEAEVAIRWDQFVSFSTMGLCTHTSNIITEYKVMREIIWQFFELHSCFSFKVENNELLIKENLTVAGVRPVAFKTYLNQLVPYFLILKKFKDFQNFLHSGEYFTPSIPDTFRSYNCALQDILKPVFQKIMECEEIIRKQESTYTLISLARDLRPYFKKLDILFKIHNTVIRNYHQVDDSFANATFLLSQLYSGLLNSSSKTEQNIYLTLYLDSLFKYFTTIEMWLSQDVLQDFSDEFVILDKTKQNLLDKPNLNTEFEIRNLKGFLKSDGMLKIICTIVFQLGKSNHLLKKLGKAHVTNENDETKESLHQEYCKMVLEEINKYINNPVINEYVHNLKIDIKKVEEDYDKIKICPDIPKSKSGMDNLSNFIDINDPFLMPVFEKYFLQNEIVGKSKQEKTLYELIDSNIDRTVPIWQILENKFMEVLKNRYGVPGLLVKEILIEKYDLYKYFSLLRRLFLFEDDIIFPLYKKMFAQFEEGQVWGNFFWLTSHLQDLLMDPYPDFYENCRVDVEQNWRQLTNPLEAWDAVSVHFKINWPINLIIQPNHMSQYLELFQFILKIKWALYTLSGLNFSDIEPRNKKFNFLTPHLQYRIRRLQLMRFRLLNDVSSVQHYILGHLFSTVLKTFNQKLEESNDLDTLIDSHNIFIDTMHSFCLKLRDHDRDSYGFAKVLILVEQLQNMWKNINNFTEKLLKECEREYLKCNRYLRPIIQVDILF